MVRRNSTSSSGRFTLGAILVVLSLLLMIGDQAGFLRPLKQVTSTVFTPVQQATYQLGTNLGRFSDFFSDNERLRAENAKLRQELQAANAEQGKVAELASRVDELEKQLEFRRNPENKKLNTVNAEVINRDTSEAFHAIIINKGSNEGLDKGMAVVDISGYLVGRIARTDPKQSYVLLISDSNIGVKVYTERYGPEKQKLRIDPPLDGTTIGQFQRGTAERIRIGRIEPKADVKADDWVFTSGLGNTFPPKLLVGKIERVIYTDGQPEKEAIVRPIADLDHIQQVMVITNREPIKE